MLDKKLLDTMYDNWLVDINVIEVKNSLENLENYLNTNSIVRKGKIIAKEISVDDILKIIESLQAFSNEIKTSVSKLDDSIDEAIRYLDDVNSEIDEEDDYEGL